MRNARAVGGGRQRWRVLIAPTLTVTLCGILLAVWASGAVDSARSGGLFMLMLAVSCAPRDLGVLTKGAYRERWRVRTTQVALIDVGLHLFLLVFGMGAGLAIVFSLTGALSIFVYELFFFLLSATLLAGFAVLVTGGTASGTAER